MHDKPRLLERFAGGSLCGCFTRLDVATGQVPMVWHPRKLGAALQEQHAPVPLENLCQPITQRLT
jgi:hypothetical protein